MTDDDRDAEHTHDPEVQEFIIDRMPSSLECIIMADFHPITLSSSLRELSSAITDIDDGVDDAVILPLPRLSHITFGRSIRIETW